MDNVKVLRPDDAPWIIKFEKAVLELTIEDEMEREMSSWGSSWREESLNHYLPLGWSFAKWAGEEGQSELLGYFLGQAQLFTQSQTQTLWVERLHAKDEDVASELIELAYRLSREKHFQKVVFSDVVGSEEPLLKWKAQEVKRRLFEIKTTKGM